MAMAPAAQIIPRVPLAPAAPVVPVASVLDQATQDKLAKIDRLEEAMRNSKSFEGYALDLEGLFGGPRARLPDKFKMPDVDKFDGTGNPISHLRAVSDTLQSLGLSPDQIAVLLPRTLTSAAREWYHLLDPAVTQNWKSTVHAFIKQYEYNLTLRITLRDLENTYQEPREGYSDFLMRWKTKASQMINRPEEEEQVRLVTRNLRPEYIEKLEYQGITTFLQMDRMCAAVDEAIHSGRIKREAPSQGARLRRSTHPNPSTAATPAVNVLAQPQPSQYTPPPTQYIPPPVQYQPPPIIYQQPPTSPQPQPRSYPPPQNQYRPPAHNTPQRPPFQNNQSNGPRYPTRYNQAPPRNFTKLDVPLKVVLRRLIEKGLIQLFDPQPLLNPLPPNFNLNAYCELHRSQGHDTERCMKLRHLVQNLIDNGKIAPPTTQAPNVNTNPLPNHQASSSQANINMIEFDVVCFDPSVFIVPRGSPMPKIVAPDFLLVSVIGDDIWYEDPNESYDDIFRVQGSEDQGSEGVEGLWDAPRSIAHDRPVITFEELNAKVEEISGILEGLRMARQANHLTRSGRHFKPHELEGNAPGREEIAARDSGLDKRFVKADDQNKGKGKEMAEESPILKQLQKTQAQISIWGLLMASQAHRQAVLDMLNKYDVDANTTPEQLVSLITARQAKPVIAFTDEDLPPQGSTHNLALYITVESMGFKVGRCLVDNGSTLR